MTYDILITGLIIVAQILAVVVPVLISVAFLVYAERKVLALIQLRMTISFGSVSKSVTNRQKKPKTVVPFTTQ